VVKSRGCKFYYDPETANYLIQYRGNFKEQIDKVSYACGDIITNNIGVISVRPTEMHMLLKDVPAIIFSDFRNMFVLQDISPTSVDNIGNIKINPYLNLTGRGVIIGIIDTGIDYLNSEFIKEDGTTRIISIWDQSIETNNNEDVYMGQTYSSEKINLAINAFKNKQNPYSIVPSKDERGHGTKVAGIIGARGYNGQFQGIAHDSDFLIVKLFESSNFKRNLQLNGIIDVPTYNASEIAGGLEYLKEMSIKLQKPIVIFIGVGSNEGAHDGFNLISRYLSSLGENIGICLVAGVGNEGAAQGHVSGYIKNVGDIKEVQLQIPREFRKFSFYIWVQKPNRASVNVISPTGEESNVIESKLDKKQTTLFGFVNTTMTVRYYTPEYFTGHEAINITFDNIKPGIWRFNLIGVYVTSGRFDIWLPPKDTLPENTVFIEPDPYTTITLPAMAPNVITVAYYGMDKALIASSGKGFNANNRINPDVATIGIDVLTTKVAGGVTTMSGSSAATAIVAGVCALLLEWGIVRGNDTTMYSRKIRTYIMYGADREQVYKYPNREVGYGDLDLLGIFDVLSKSYRGEDSSIMISNNVVEIKEKRFIEYTINKLFVRIPIDRN